MEKIIKNCIRCKKCGQVIVSKHPHDFVTCKCGACSVDGGNQMLRRVYEEEGCYEELSKVKKVDDN
jgi:phage FluMu protein Com